MSVKYFIKDDVPVMFDPETFKICMLLGDQWIEVADENLRNAIRFQSKEISRTEALMLAARRLCSLNSPGSRPQAGCQNGPQPS